MIRKIQLLLVVLAACLAMTAAQAPQIPKSQDRPARPTKAQLAEGEKLYRHYCASCHGLDGRGSGPVTPALKNIPPDLTRIEKKGGRFPAEELRKSIAGENSIDVHGASEMPVWGTVLPKKEIDSLVFYLESIQRLM
ncbi:MAG: cytochrome c [Acidobacteriota bacterium]|nr:MAG: cytochrome c [Acidobacteriota bacterium]